MIRISPLRLLAGTFLILALAACNEQSTQKGPPPAPPVTIAAPVKRSVIEREEYVGRFVAVNSVEIRARVSGYLEKIHFEDGQLVQAGALLFTVDPRPFQNTLDQAKGVLAQARAQLALATADLGRAEKLIKDKTISEQQFDQRVQAQKSAQASVASSEASVKQAELDLEFTQLRAPVTGRIGDRRVSPGNYVTGGAIPSTTLLATIVSINPIRFEFSFNESDYLKFARLQNRASQAFARDSDTPVELKLLDEQDFTHKGTIDFVDNVIDQSSGAIRGRAEFRNPNGIFTPGMFARIRVPSAPPFEALLIPDSAIGSEQSRKFVYVVDQEGTVSQKYVTLGQLDRGLRVIREGIAENDRVIVNGLLRARPGAKVTAMTEEQAAAAAKGGAPKGNGADKGKK
jgi:membrane fusion protein, multidrug efflux system